MIVILAICAFLFLCWLSVCFRVIIIHPLKAVYYGIKDSINYIRHKKWRRVQTGRILAYIGMFRAGKTLSGVEYIVELFKQYDGLKVYDDKRKKWVTQKVHVVSNVEFTTIPFEYLISLEQVVHISNTAKDKDIENDTLTVHIIFIDEASVQLNSRAFKHNMDPLFLNSLLTCGHVYMMLIYTAQCFTDVDALLRRVTSFAFECQKCWRVMVQYKYNAKELEFAANPYDVTPITRLGWFITDAHFNAYDTLACVGNLKKTFEAGDFMSEEEILALQCNTPTDMDAVQKPSRRFIRRRKKLK